MFLIQLSLILNYLFIITAEEKNNNETKNSDSTKQIKNSLNSITFNRIKGCPDLESLQQYVDTSDRLGRVNCLCGPSRGELTQNENFEEDDKAVSVTCIYGSTLKDLENIINLAKMSNKSIEKIILNHVDFENEKDLLQILIEEPEATLNLKYFEAKKCKNQPKFNEKNEYSERIKFNVLEWIIIEECLIEEMPLALLKRSPALKGLMLSGNKIRALNVTDFEASKTSLESLNLAGNFLSSQIEAGSLSQLEILKNLEIGEHNFASNQLLIEIGKLTTLENLDMSQMDGIERTKSFLKFEKMNSLKRLLLSGCNLRSLNASSFVQFPALEMLDLRVNLIEKLENGCFVGLDNLNSLSLAGNFLKELSKNIWKDVPNLENLDLGWNDFRSLNKFSFEEISPKIERINLRNNEVLKQIENGTFDGLNELKHLNLSNTLLGKITRGQLNLPKLEELDLSASNISFIEPNAFEAFKTTLESLNLASNKFKHIDEYLLEFPNLRLLDLSNNPWICDEKMQNIALLIEDKYKNAALEKTDFELREEHKTQCDRPYTRRGESIFSLVGINKNELSYNEKEDTTIATISTTSRENLFEENNVENATLDWKAITLLVGSNIDEHINFTSLLEQDEQEDANKPKYDINAIRYGEKSYLPKKELANTWISGVTVTLLIITTAFCIIFVARHKKNVPDEAKTEQINKTKEVKIKEPEKIQKNPSPEITPTIPQKQQKTCEHLEENCAITVF
ncbi:hypothetical protein Mgra_00006534 [Meloidogyne graminicola]|uniref:Uncharacterized protein n=1 Tax=Meloidogyne graminicola TaxID=189291 RepID=A0A8S9ZLE7_9BILA|nr:hypothetical protein Mgra_00006534 [Meloidogyne graminicola]